MKPESVTDLSDFYDELRCKLFWRVYDSLLWETYGDGEDFREIAEAFAFFVVRSPSEFFGADEFNSYRSILDRFSDDQLSIYLDVYDSVLESFQLQSEE